MAAVDRVNAFIKSVNETYKGGIVETGAKLGGLNLARFSSGILSLDLATGGGWPFGRFAIIAGEESTGKTLIGTKAAASVEEYDHKTKRHKDFCMVKKMEVKDGKPTETFVLSPDFEPGRALIVDVEGTWDAEWAKANGFNDSWHCVCRPEHAEQAIDIVTTAIDGNVFDYILVDSLAAFAPTKEIEASTEEWQMGLAARLTNKACRKWNSRMNKTSQTGTTGPCVIMLNQFRINIGQMFGDPRVLPGGKAQRFVASIIIYTKTPDYGDSKDLELAEVELAGVVGKNKTFPPKRNYKCMLTLKDGGEVKKGQINNVDQLMEQGKKYGLIKTGKVTAFGTREFPTQRAMADMLEASPSLYRQLWRSIIKAAADATV